MSTAALPYVVLTGVFFGTSLIAARFATGQFAPATFTGLRLMLAGVGFVAVYLVGGGRRPWPTDPGLWRHALFLGVIGIATPMFLTVLALQYLSSGVTSMLTATGPAITVILAHFLLTDETLSWRKGAGVGLALSGAMFLAVSGQSGLSGPQKNPLIGYALIGVVMLAVSITTIYARRNLRGYQSMDVASTQLFVAAVLVAPFLLLIGGKPASGAIDWRGVAALFYAALSGTLIAIILYFENVRRFGATAAAMSQYVIPVVATVGGILLLHERFTPSMAFGIILIVGGITLLRT